MSLVGTLGKLAVGALVAKGVGKVVQNQMGGRSAGRPSSGGGLGDMGNLLGGSQNSGGAAGSAGGATGGGGLADLLGGVLGGAGGAGGAAGGLGGLLESLGAGAGGAGAGAGGLGDLLNSAIQGKNPVEVQANPDQEQQAEILMRAMLNAVKSDGRLDDQEKQKITEQLGSDVTREDMAFVQSELAAPLDVDNFVRSVPRGMEQQVYLMSLMAIDLDSKAEADYLDKLGKALGINEAASNQIHSQLGVPTLYT